MRKGLSVAKKKLGRSIDEEGIITKKLRILRDKGKEFFIAKKKKLVTTKRLGTFRQTRGRRFRFEKLGFFIFIFMIKNQQRKCFLKMAELFRKENSDARYNI